MNHKEIARFFGGLTGDIRTATNSKDKDLMTFERFLLDVALNNKDEYVLRFKKDTPLPPSLFEATAAIIAPKDLPLSSAETSVVKPNPDTEQKPSGHRTCVESVANNARLVVADIALLSMANQEEHDYLDRHTSKMLGFSKVPTIAFSHDDFRLFFLTKYETKTYPSYSTTYRILHSLATNRMVNSVNKGRQTKIFFSPSFLLYLAKLIPEGNMIIETAASHLAPKVRINFYNEKLEKLWRMVDGFDWYATVYLLWNIVLDTRPDWTGVNKSLVLYQFVEDLLSLLHKSAGDRKNKILFNSKHAVIKTTHRLLLLPNNREYLDASYFSPSLSK